MLAHIVMFLLTYTVSTVVLMYANTTWLGLGDVKFGTSGWTLYWWIWATAFSPTALAAIVIACRARLPEQQQAKLLWICLPIILACMEVSFFLDLQWPILLVLWGLLPAVFYLIGQYCLSSPKEPAH